MRPNDSFVAKAAAAWGEDIPDWVMVFAEAADAGGLKAAGKAIGRSEGLVSSVLANKYGADVGDVAERVRGAFMNLKVECPVLGEIGRDRCLDEQKQAFRDTSPARVQLYFACRGGCPNFRKGGADGR